jgi:hypothetical protein
MLSSGLPRVYSSDLYEQKRSAVSEHFYDSFPGRDVNVLCSSVALQWAVAQMLAVGGLRWVKAV